MRVLAEMGWSKQEKTLSKISVHLVASFIITKINICLRYSTHVLWKVWVLAPKVFDNLSHISINFHKNEVENVTNLVKCYELAREVPC